MSTEQTAPPDSGVRGVTWNEGHKRWTVSIGRNGKNVYLGEYQDLHVAVALRQDAENTPDESLPLLKARYKAMRVSPPPTTALTVAPDHAAQALPVDPCQRLPALFEAAIQADREAIEASEEASRAVAHANTKRQHAVKAWDRYADCLAEIGRNLDSAFLDSRLGQLFDRE